ncbi:unnamed protein product, partial [Sphacelaria rigidula]
MAYSELAHIGVDNVLFALRLRQDSSDPLPTGAASTSDNARAGRKRQVNPRKKRDAVEALLATAGAQGITASVATIDAPGALLEEAVELSRFDKPCKNNACLRRNVLEDRLVSRAGQAKAVWDAKLRRVHKLGRTVIDIEKHRDAAVGEVASLEQAAVAVVAEAEELRKRAQSRDEENRRIAEELSRLEVELRKLRRRHQEEIQQSLPPPTGSIISEVGEWTTSEGQPFTPDGLTVTFSRSNGGRNR